MDKVELRNPQGDIYAIISKAEHNPWIYVQWVGYIDVDTVKQGVLEISRLTCEIKCPYVLSDRRVAQGNWFEINNWLEHKWAPEAIKSGLQYLAHVMAPMANSQMSSQDLESRVLTFNFKSFLSLEAAENWLRQIAERAVP